MNCPKCGSKLYRTARKPLDRLVSLFVPLGRYYCRTPSCGWRGVRRRSPRDSHKGQSSLSN